jgi:hypothetical protein
MTIRYNPTFEAEEREDAKDLEDAGGRSPPPTGRSAASISDRPALKS